MEVTAKALRTQTKRLLETVARGEEVIITYRGKPRAKLVAVEAEPPCEPAATELFGMWRDHEASKDVLAYLDRLREGRF